MTLDTPMRPQKTTTLAERFAPEYVESHYTGAHTDLRKFKGARARAHYEEHGRREGRRASPAADRTGFLSCIPYGVRTLEIGPFHAPAFKGPNVKYLDIMSRDALVAHAQKIKLSTENIPATIDFVSETGDLSVVDAQFDVVFSSHVVEHQPNFVGHLNAAARLLHPGGCYAMIVPDHRYCFDAFQQESCIGEVVEAHLQNRRLHSLKTIIEHTAQTTHNDVVRHWRGDHGEIDNVTQRLKSAISLWRAHQDKYVDMHAWRFTPQSFRAICEALASLDLLDLKLHRVYDTPHNTCEFCVVFEKPHG
jgi:predicted SAM-dependent methyltransferase